MLDATGYDYKIILGVAGSIVGIVSYVPYFRNMFLGKTKPHPFSWFVWGLVSTTAFFAQIVSGGGIGAWTTGISALACFGIAALAVFFGERRVTKLDIICFIGALIGIALWKLTSNPLNAVVVVLIVHFLGFIPTVRKGYALPGEETVLTWALSLVKWVLGFFALKAFTLVTILFPLAVFVMNASFLGLIVVRRKQLSL